MTDNQDDGIDEVRLHRVLAGKEEAALLWRCDLVCPRGLVKHPAARCLARHFHGPKRSPVAQIQHLCTYHFFQAEWRDG